MTWVSIGTDEPRDQQRDLPGVLWAEIGPDSRKGWTWVVLGIDNDDNQVEVASGDAATEDEVKAAVQAYEDSIDTSSSASRQHHIDTGFYLLNGEAYES